MIYIFFMYKFLNKWYEIYLVPYIKSLSRYHKYIIYIAYFFIIRFICEAR